MIIDRQSKEKIVKIFKFYYFLLNKDNYSIIFVSYTINCANLGFY